MSRDILQANDEKVIRKNKPVEILRLLSIIKNHIWFFGIPIVFIGIATKTIASLTDGYVSNMEFTHLWIASFFFLSWLCLKPEKFLNSDRNDTNSNHQTEFNIDRDRHYISIAQTRMSELQEYHLISQIYTLPFPYICQIYHLLNLKHLETVHSFSLNNLKVIGVDRFQPTETGGALKFQTMLVNSVNVLRMWRRPVVEVELTLHTPFTVELNIPVYNGKRIIVIFNAIPLNQNEHKFFVDIYSDLEWHKPLLQFILHFSSCLTLFEDLPYLQALAQRNLGRLINLNRFSSHKTMLLYNRFVELYSSRKELVAGA